MKKVNVLGEKYKVVRKVPKKYRDEINPEAYYGVCISEDNIIWVREGLEGKMYWTTLMHEVGHATIEACGIRYSGLVPIEIEEIIVESNAKAMYRLFQDMAKDMLKEDDATLRSRLEEIVKSK